MVHAANARNRITNARSDARSEDGNDDISGIRSHIVLAWRNLDGIDVELEPMLRLDRLSNRIRADVIAHEIAGHAGHATLR
jgi:hypothetical protein